MKSTKTFNEMCNYIHELLTSLGYTYNFYLNAVEYCLGNKDLFIIFINGNDTIWEKDSFDSPWHKVENNEAGEYELSCINQLTDYAKEFVKLYKQTKVDSRKKKLKRTFNMNDVDFYEFAKDFKEYLYSLGFISLTTDCLTNYFYGEDYKNYFSVNTEYKSIWYRESNTAKWSKLNVISPLYVSYLKQIAAKLVKTDKQNNIKKAIEEINKDFE